MLYIVLATFFTPIETYLQRTLIINLNIRITTLTRKLASNKSQASL